MSVGTFQIAQPTPERVDITLRGSVTDEMLMKLLQQLEARFDATRGALVSVELSGVTEVTAAARMLLVRVQNFWKPRARRSAYLAEQAWLRGMALYVVHAAADGNARAFGTPTQVAEWLESTELRADSVRQRTLDQLAAARRTLAELGAQVGGKGL